MPILHHHLVAFALAMAAAATLPARADIVTLGQNPQALPQCPLTGLPAFCIVDTGAQVLGAVGSYEAVRIGRSPGYAHGAGLLIDGSANSLTLSSQTLSANLIVGDAPGAAGGLSVSRGASLRIQVPTNGNGSGGLFVGAFAAPTDAPPGLGGLPLPSTVASITQGAHVVVDKPGGVNVAAAVGVGYGAGSRSSLVLDAGIYGFGVQEQPVSLSTQGNVSIGRQGSGDVSLVRLATLNAGRIYMSTIDPQGQSSLGLYDRSTVNAEVIAGIALDTRTGLLDPSSTAHGTAVVSVGATSRIAGPVTLGPGGTLYGTGHVGGVANLGGTLRPGFSPGTLHVDGDLVDEAGRLVFEIGPSARDFIDVGGDLRLHGTTIEFDFIDGFAPMAGDSYRFIDADGELDLRDLHLAFHGLMPGFRFDVAPDPLTGGLVFTALTDGVSVPEPATGALLPLAALAAVLAQRRRPRAHCHA